MSQLISSAQAYHYRIIPVEAAADCLYFKSDQVSDALTQELKIILNKEVKLLQDSTDNIQQYLSVNFRPASKQHKDLQYSADFLEKLLLTAKDIGSSDIHFEPYEFSCRVRYRLDGKLKEQFIISLEDYPVIVNKLKIKANLDISEKRLPQDGRISVKARAEDFDIRLSTLPTLHGEKIVLRILSKDAERVHLNSLGFSKSALTDYLETLKKPNGIVLISGPTGSGKTTTLYATLKHLNNVQTNILTIEDPIEYTLEGINQVQLKESIGLDFASTLRTFLRQDPDVIMVGEIRDEKTASMAIRAALTGHLVLSTIHTNSAWATISRLIDMGIPPFLIASTLNISVAQRLVRRLCTACKREIPISKAQLPKNFKIPTTLKTHFKAVGCNGCFHTGYQGRQAIYELLPLDKTLSDQIKNKASDIDNYRNKYHIKTLKDNALALVSDGTTSIAEVYALLSH